MQFKRRKELKRTRIEIIPMIDTMFFLLVFFMLSSLALTRLNGLPVNLPPASTAPRQVAVDLTLTIDARQKIYLNREPITLLQVEEKLRKAVGANSDLVAASVVINADETVPYGLVVQCIDKARGAGITKFSISTSPQKSKQ